MKFNNTETATLRGMNLTCDACSYEEAWELDRDTKEAIGKPCPHCGANLLTQEDHDAMEAILELTQVLDEMLGPELGGKDNNKATMGIRVHGNKLSIRGVDNE